MDLSQHHHNRLKIQSCRNQNRNFECQADGKMCSQQPRMGPAKGNLVHGYHLECQTNESRDCKAGDQDSYDPSELAYASVQQTYANPQPETCTDNTYKNCVCSSYSVNNALPECNTQKRCLIPDKLSRIGAQLTACLCHYKDSIGKSYSSLSNKLETSLVLSRNLNCKNSSSTFFCYQSDSFVISLFKFCIVLLCISTSSVSAQTWEAIPKNSSDKMGGSIKLMCGVRNLAGRNVQWLQSNDDGSGTRVLFLNGDKWETAVTDRYSVSQHTASGAGVDGYDLTLSGLLQEDDKIYDCGVQNMNDGKRQAKVTVLVSPGQPAITLDKDLAALTEGDTVVLTCSSRGGNPQPTLRWFRNGLEVTGAQVTPPSAKFGITQSVLTRALSRDDHRAVFKCSAENEANPGQPVEKALELSVQFAPVIDVGQYNPLRVIEGAAVNLLCNVDANPAVRPQDVQWLDQNDSPLGLGFEYTISKVEAIHGGKYTCRAENTVSVTTKILMLEVQYPPKVTLVYSQGVVKSTNQLHVTENQPLNMSCQVDANPPVDLNTVEWRKGTTLVHTGGYYYFPTVHRDDTSEYNCSSKNTLSPSGGSTQQHTGSASLQLFVQYPPGKATIAVPPLPIKNENAELTCSADDLGFPTAQLQWTVLGSATIIGTGAKLSFTPLQLHHTDDYICTLSNDIGQGTPDSKRLNVLELPEWIGGAPSLPSLIETSINQTQLSVQCELRGNPQPRITWYKNGDLIDLAGGYFKVVEHKNSIDTHSWNVTSVLQWRGFKRGPHETSLLPEDTGKYKCHSVSDIDGTGLQTTTELMVYYPPVLETPSTKVAVDVNQPATFHCRSHSLPETIFQWYNGTQKLTAGGRVEIKSEKSSGEFPYTSTLTISNIQTYDFSVYRCKGTNNQGSNTLDISLTVKTVPDAPKNLLVVSKTWESVQLSWEPGFDGGYTQSYTISYTSHSQRSGHVEAGTTAHHNVTLLYPAANYTFVVYGRNNLGSGTISSPVYTTTDHFIIEPPTNVQYDPNTYTVTFESHSSHYCARIDTFDGNHWTNYVPCAPTESGQVKIAEDLVVDALHTSLCLETRQDVCSDNVTAHMVEQEEDLPTYVVIVIGVICAVIVITLLIVLVCLCVRRRQTDKDEEETDKPTATVKPQPGNNGHVTTALQPQQPVTYDNPSLDKSHSPVDERMNSVFTTESSQPNYDYYNNRPNGQLANGGPNHHHHQQQPYLYDNSTNIQRERSFKSSRDVPDLYSVPNKIRNTSTDKPYLYLEDPAKYQPKDTHNNSGEGSTSSDPKQPKKVMYEVVV